jgi:hypothetical protein
MRQHRSGLTLKVPCCSVDPSGSSSFDLGVTGGTIFADGAAKLRSRAAPSARIEPQIMFLTEP